MTAEGRYGLTLDDVAGSIRKSVSYWAIDESGNPSRKRTEDGKAFTLSAITELSPIDYRRLLEDVPKRNGEVHFNHLLHSYPDVCVRLMIDLGRENILIVSMTVRKRSKDVRSVKGIPRDELYLYALLRRLIDVILIVDLSDTVAIAYDRNPQYREESCGMLWNDRCVLLMDDSVTNRLVQMADLSASSIGKSELPPGFADGTYFDGIRHRTVRIEELGGCTQQPPSAPSVTTDSGYKKHRPRSFLGRFFRKGGSK